MGFHQTNYLCCHYLEGVVHDLEELTNLEELLKAVDDCLGSYSYLSLAYLVEAVLEEIDLGGIDLEVFSFIVKAYLSLEDLRDFVRLEVQVMLNYSSQIPNFIIKAAVYHHCLVVVVAMVINLQHFFLQ
jgi:hypothetical protein